MLEELEKQEEDEETLKGIKELKKKKSFSSVINKRKVDGFELDEVMV